MSRYIINLHLYGLYDTSPLKLVYMRWISHGLHVLPDISPYFILMIIFILVIDWFLIHREKGNFLPSIIFPESRRGQAESSQNSLTQIIPISFWLTVERTKKMSSAVKWTGEISLKSSSTSTFYLMDTSTVRKCTIWNPVVLWYFFMHSSTDLV